MKIIVTLLLIIQVVNPNVCIGQTIRLVSFNIRYDTPQDSINRWGNRKWLINDYLQEKNLDIICLQEVSRKQLEDLSELLSEYSYVSLGRNRGDNKGLAVPIFYNFHKFICLNNGRFWLSETPNLPGSVGWDANLPRLLNWAEFQEKKTGNCFFVVNTHLDNKGSIARVNAMKLIKDSLMKFSNSPIILTGDLNCPSMSDVHRIAEEYLFELNDAFIIAERKVGVPYSFHNFGKALPRRRRIDHILTSKGIRVKKIDIQKEECVNGVFMSDHNPVMVILKLPTMISF